MKRETKVRAMERILARRAAGAEAEAAVENATAACRGTLEADAVAAATEAWKANQTAEASTKAWKSMAKAQRDYAASAVSAAIAIGESASWLGGSYSGATDRAVLWGDHASARTVTRGGDRYSRSCKYSKTDASHEVTISVDGMVDLVDTMLSSASADEGLPLISYHAATGEAIWVVVRNKRIAAEHGWLAFSGGFLYHSTESLDHARSGVARKLAAAAKEAGRVTRDGRADRRAALVIRLCQGAQATVADALAAGYCPAGIRAWQEKNGIGDSAALADLVRTGDPLATRLAFDLARKVRREAAAV